MCLVYSNQQRLPISRPNNFKNVFEARVFSCKHAKIHWFDNKYFVNHVRIFKIPFGKDVVMYDDGGLDTIDLWLTYFETKYSRKILAVSVIQKMYRIHYKKRMDSIIFLQLALRKAIINPYTPLCKRRLINEFYNLI
jgi:hypothetical protein